MSSTIIVIDEDAFFREKVAGYLQQYAELTVIYQADDARTGEAAALKYRPAIALIALSLPDCGESPWREL